MREDRRRQAKAARFELVWSAMAVVLCCSGQAEADVVRPQEPIVCKRGQVVTNDHSSTHCEYRICLTDIVCPEGMACVARSETHCDPRGKPCWTRTVSRCAEIDRATPRPGCPPGSASDRKRTQEALARLRSQDDGKRMVAELGREPVVCYGDAREGVLQDNGVLVLQRDRPLPANAARLGHLLSHLLYGLPFDEKIVRTSKLSCSELAKLAGEAEQAASRLETVLREAFRFPPLPFEDLSAEYAKRCQALRKK